jgi:O-acetyl-ADP-ribose deacetylase (regulator of RNase III)
MTAADACEWMLRLKVRLGDITTQKVDAIVNAANSTLLGGGGVDGAIHRAAGPKLLEECRGLNGCDTGDAKMTSAHKLPAKCVIHTVGPVWEDGMHGEDELLARCYRSCFNLLVEHDLRSIAFPAISTGAYGFPLDRSASIALFESKAFLERNTSVERVIHVCFGKQHYDTYCTALQEMIPD